MNYEALYKALLADQQRLAPLQQVALHIARVSLYELKGIEALYPDLKDKAKSLVAVMQRKGRPIVFLEGYRTAKRQDELYNQVPKVTNAKGFQSYHNYCFAFDVNFQQGGYNAPDAWWKDLGAEGKKLGLVWGGDWTSFPDKPHFEYTQGVTWQQLQPYFQV